LRGRSCPKCRLTLVPTNLEPAALPLWRTFLVVPPYLQHNSAVCFPNLPQEKYHLNEFMSGVQRGSNQLPERGVETREWRAFGATHMMHVCREALELRPMIQESKKTQGQHFSIASQPQQPRFRSSNPPIQSTTFEAASRSYFESTMKLP
jgi:hypothetical protein